MNKAIFIILAALILTTALVSARPICDGTTVKGVVFEKGGDEYNRYVSNAEVNVTCNGDSILTTANGKGRYSVTFPGNECEFGAATVSTANGAFTGQNDGKVSFIWEDDKLVCSDYTNLVVWQAEQVALVPEFSLVLGSLTIVAAIATFLIIRKK